MLTISRLAAQFGLSRSTLLYYDSIGLLSPGSRSAKGYRYYSDREARRLRKICLYRKVGLSLGEIREILDGTQERISIILEERLEELNREVTELREQQRLILKILKNPELEGQIRPFSKESWVKLLSDSGFTQSDMHRWHHEFESRSPESHQKFLEFLCIREEEIEEIRKWSRQFPENADPEIS